MSKPLITDYDEFAEIWNAAPSPRDVAQHYTMSVQAAFRWASVLRKKGYILKAFQQKINKVSFAEIWQSSTTLTEVAERSGLPAKTCKVKAYAMRAEGYTLKKFKTPSEKPSLSPLYVAGLFDASGYLEIRERQRDDMTFYAVKAALHISNQPLLELVSAEYGGKIQHTKRGAISLDWNSRAGIEKLLLAIEKHLVLMANKAKEMLKFIEEHK